MPRRPLDLDATPQDVLRMLRGGPRPFLLLGAWAGGGAIAASTPCERGDSPLSRTDANEGTVPSVAGGWFGWLGYGVGAEIEALPPQPPRPHPLPDRDVAYYDHVYRMEPDGTWWHEWLDGEEPEVELGKPDRRSWSLDGMAMRAPGADGHRWAVADAVRRIAEGELFQANLTLRLEGELDGRPARRLRRRDGDACAALLGVLRRRRPRGPVLLARAVPAPAGATRSTATRSRARRRRARRWPARGRTPPSTR